VTRLRSARAGDAGTSGDAETTTECATGYLDRAYGRNARRRRRRTPLRTRPNEYLHVDADRLLQADDGATHAVTHATVINTKLGLSPPRSALP
jgi:hypothetical protein